MNLPILSKKEFIIYYLIPPGSRAKGYQVPKRYKKILDTPTNLPVTHVFHINYHHHLIYFIFYLNSYSNSGHFKVSFNNFWTYFKFD